MHELSYFHQSFNTLEKRSAGQAVPEEEARQRSRLIQNEQLTKDLQKWVKTNFAAHAYPRHITYVEELPKTPSGKIQRFVLREQRRSEILREQKNG